MDLDKMPQPPDRVPMPTVGLGSIEPLSAGALARRRALFKGIGKGGAVLAASVPIQTLAGQQLLTAGGLHVCSVSGMHSGVHSANTSTVYCGGKSPGWWGQSQIVSGKLCPKRTWPTLPNSWTYDTKCATVFTRRTLTGNPTLFQVMNPPTYASYDEFHWICAWLNALSNTGIFPYNGQQVLEFYNTNNADALTFFKTYLEQL